MQPCPVFRSLSIGVGEIAVERFGEGHGKGRQMCRLVEFRFDIGCFDVDIVVGGDGCGSCRGYATQCRNRANARAA